jgi:protein SCO1
VTPTRILRYAMRMLIAAAAIMVACVAPTWANFTTAQLASISASPPPGAALPLDLVFRDESDRPTTIKSAISGAPALVIFADYTCRTLCGPIVEFVAAGLGKTGLRPGLDYRLVVIGINPRDGIDTARAMRANHIDPGNSVGQAAVFLSGTDANIHATTKAVGLHYAYDPEHDQYAHPAAAYVVDSGGRVRRVLSPLGLDGGDLRLAIIDAGRGAVGTFADQLHLLCYGYDPAKGIYTERITTMLGYAAGTTLIVVLASVLFMIAHERRRTAA